MYTKQKLPYRPQIVLVKSFLSSSSILNTRFISDNDFEGKHKEYRKNISICTSFIYK
jgi:hypothetical protein